MLDPEYVDWSEIQVDLDFIGNTPPAIEDHVLYVSSKATVGNVVGSVEGYDADIASGISQELKYVLTGGSGANLFKVKASNGEIVFVGENPLTNGDRYTLNVTVNDSIDPERGDEGVVTLLIQHSPNRPPAKPTPIVPRRNDAPVFYSRQIDKDKGALLIPYKGRLAESAYDPDGDALTFRKLSGPDWLVVHKNGQLSGTPPLSDFGRNRFEIEAEDTTGKTATTVLEILVFDNPLLWANLITDDFEFPDVFGNWVPDSKELDSRGRGGHLGNQSLPLSTGSGLTSIVSAQAMDLRGASYMKIDFRVRPASPERGGNLLVDFSNDGGSSWQTAKRYDLAKNFVAGMWEARMVILKNKPHDFNANVKVRFRIDGSGKKGSVLLDNVCIAQSKH